MAPLFFTAETILHPHASAMNRPVSWLRIEGLAVLTLGLASYFSLEGGWGFLLLLFFVPDISMVGYLGGRRLGAFSYNLFHSYTGPLVLLGAAWAGTEDLLLRVALVWVAHIGFDRMLGYGLKFDSGFQDTHLGRIGRAPATAEAVSPDAAGYEAVG